MRSYCDPGAVVPGITAVAAKGGNFELRALRHLKQTLPLAGCKG